MQHAVTLAFVPDDVAFPQRIVGEREVRARIGEADDDGSQNNPVESASGRRRGAASTTYRLPPKPSRLASPLCIASTTDEYRDVDPAKLGDLAADSVPSAACVFVARRPA